MEWDKCCCNLAQKDGVERKIKCSFLSTANQVKFANQASKEEEEEREET